MGNGKLIVVIMKVIAAVILLIAFAIGTAAHVGSQFTILMKLEHGEELCKEAAGNINFGRKQGKSVKEIEKKEIECPTYAIPMEIIFIVLTSILLVVSIVMIVMGLVAGQQIKKTCDGGYSAVAGILIIFAGILMIASAILIDKYSHFGHDDDDLDKLIFEGYTQKQRDGTKFVNKLVAGALAIIDGIIYFVVCAVICTSSN